jgi:hypothetical protein
MHFTPLAGLRSKNKNSTDRLRKFCVIVTKGNRNNNQARLLEAEAWGEK